METVYYATLKTPVGSLTICCSEKGLMEVSTNGLPRRQDGSVRWVESAARTKQAAAELQEYFAGRRQRFTLPLDLRGTPFQRKVWNALLRIPYGETRSYGEIAREIGQPRAFRAVGMANHHNPIGIVVPCHRVVQADGGLGGYGGGLPVKRFLLDLEKRGAPLS